MMVSRETMLQRGAIWIHLDPFGSICLHETTGQIISAILWFCSHYSCCIHILKDWPNSLVISVRVSITKHYRAVSFPWWPYHKFTACWRNSWNGGILTDTYACFLNLYQSRKEPCVRMVGSHPTMFFLDWGWQTAMPSRDGCHYIYNETTALRDCITGGIALPVVLPFLVVMLTFPRCVFTVVILVYLFMFIASYLYKIRYPQHLIVFCCVWYQYCMCAVMSDTWATFGRGIEKLWGCWKQRQFLGGMQEWHRII